VCDLANDYPTSRYPHLNHALYHRLLLRPERFPSSSFRHVSQLFRTLPSPLFSFSSSFCRPLVHLQYNNSKEGHHLMALAEAEAEAKASGGH
jgi:hypothetical protein